MKVSWTITPLNTPTIKKNCPRCGIPEEFECSGNFRINAQQNKLDVWLIYKCTRCNATWNMDIFTRKKPDEIRVDILEGFLSNNPELVLKYAFDSGVISDNKVTACYDRVKYALEGEVPDIEILKTEQTTLTLVTGYSLKLRLDKLLSDELKIPRKAVRACFQAGAIRSDEWGYSPEKLHIKIFRPLTLRFEPARIKKILDHDAPGSSRMAGCADT